MARYFNYLYNNDELHDAYFICKKIIKDILEFDLDLLDFNDRHIVLELRREIEEINKIFNFSYGEISRKISDDLLSVENVEYTMIHKRYPENASKTGEEINKLFKKIFDMEDKMHTIVSKLWKNIVTPFNQIKNGESLIAIGHSGYGYINLPTSKYYKNNEYNNITSYSCSIFMNNSMNEYNSKLVMLFGITEDNFVCASYFDSATKVSGKVRDIQTLKVNQEGYSIRAGYTYTSDISKIVTKSECPTITLSKIKKNSNQINEVVLDKHKSKPTGLLLFSTGTDFLFYEYTEALKMKQEYNLDFKVINKSLYKDIPITINDVHQSLLDFENYILSQSIDYSELCSLLDGYINDVITPLKLNPQVEKLQLEFIDYLKDKIKSFKY